MELLQWTSLVYGRNKQNKQHNEHESAYKQNSTLTVILAAFKMHGHE